MAAIKYYTRVPRQPHVTNSNIPPLAMTSTMVTTNTEENGGYPMFSNKPKGHEIRTIYTRRLRNFLEPGEFKSRNLRAMFDHQRTNDPSNVEMTVWSVPDLQRPPFKEAVNHEFKPTKVGAGFGPSWSTHWFRISLTVPDSWKDYERVQLIFDCEGEGMVYTQEGECIQGLTGGTGRESRWDWILPKSFRDGKKHTLYIEVSMNGMFGCAVNDPSQPPEPDRTYLLKTADLVAPNLDAMALSTDFIVISDCARELPQDGWQSHFALQICNQIMNTYRVGSQESILKCRKLAEQFLGKNINSEKVYQIESQQRFRVSAIGHCHIDTAWLWPFAETRRKVARSWSTQLDLFERYPEHRFCCSQAQQYAWLKQDYPKLFARVKDAVKAKNFEPIGGAWVEMDANMPSGEPLARQLMFGQRFFEREFGARSRVFWLPDTFGYCAQLPQVARLAGFDYGFTQKLSWNNINSFPHTTFNWVSPNGSQMLMHMTPCEAYDVQAQVGDVIRSISQHKNLSENGDSLIVFGNGDGGGGPLAVMLEKLRRCRGVSDTVGALPAVTMGGSVLDFYSRIERESAHGRELTTWSGELYFELHRGTYTSQAHTKRNNRKSEILLHDIEYLATIASIYVSGYSYPKEKLDHMWEIVLLCQFHDVLPGSSIEMVYEDSDTLYAEVFQIGDELLKQVLAALGLNKGKPGALNCLPWSRSEVVGGKFFQGTDASATGSPVSMDEKDGVYTLRNDKLVVTIEMGTIRSIWDIQNKREVVAPGQKLGQFVMFDDQPLGSQAWDTELFSLDTREEVKIGSVKAGEKSATKASVVVDYQLSSQSKLHVTISLAAHSPYLEFACEADWHESMRFLKVEFPVDIVSTRASYETQFGLVERPTHFNTSWDTARFEVCMHKFADLSDQKYGVAVLNDCKYGFATQANVMRMSLLRAPKAPDAHADMGTHEFRFAVLPHSGPVGVPVIRAAKEFNAPLRMIEGQNEHLDAIKFSGDEAIMLETIKRGEDDEDVVTGGAKGSGKSVILRFYDALGGLGSGIVTTKFEIKAAYKTNLLEDKLEDVEVKNGNEVAIHVRTFEIYTLKLVLA